MTAYDDDVLRARAGDAAAFGRLVTRFEPMARGYARGWLKDPAAAEDAAQEAFVDAFLRLEQLEDTVAFPAWFLRVVRKHCDRRTRRARPELAAPRPEVDEGSEGAAESLDPLDPLDPLERLDAEASRALLLDALDGLPEHERLVIALHHLGDVPVAEIATLLDLSGDAVKQRLSRGRRRLRGALPAPPARPPAPFADRVALFLALRAGDADAAEAILGRRPDLLDARETWTDDEALAGGFPLAHRLTPLLTAVGRGDERMVARLLALGAQPDGRCGCEAGETPLLAAALRGHAGIVRRFLAAGADPAPRAPGGQTALELARLRGHAGVIAALEAAVDVDPAAQALGGHAPSSSPGAAAVDVDPAAQAPGDHAPSSSPGAALLSPGGFAPGEVLLTGIRAVDLLAPLREGTLVRVHGAAETGLVVLLAELSLRFAQKGRDVAWVTWPTRPWHRGEYESLARGYGLPPAVRMVEDLSAAGEAEVLVVHVPDGRRAALEARLVELKRPGRLILAVDPWAAVSRGDIPAPTLAPPFDALLATDPALARDGVYPALDLARCASRAELEPRHAQIRDAVRDAGARPEIRGVIAQPFEVARHITGRASEVSSLEMTLDAFETALRAPKTTE